MRSSGRSMHGFDLAAEEYRLLRGRPPTSAQTWVAAAVGSNARIRSIQALAGGNSSAMHLFVVEDRAGRVHRLVLRRYVRKDWLAEEPDLAEREAGVLRLLAGGPVPAPVLVAVDERGEQAGVPAVLTT